MVIVDICFRQLVVDFGKMLRFENTVIYFNSWEFQMMLLSNSLMADMGSRTRWPLILQIGAFWTQRSRCAVKMERIPRMTTLLPPALAKEKGSWLARFVGKLSICRDFWIVISSVTQMWNATCALSVEKDSMIHLTWKDTRGHIQVRFVKLFTYVLVSCLEQQRKRFYNFGSTRPKNIGIYVCMMYGQFPVQLKKITVLVLDSFFTLLFC